MKIEDSAVFLTVPAALFCDAPENYSGFDLLIKYPWDERLPGVLDELYCKTVRACTPSGEEVGIDELPREAEYIYIKRPDFLNKKNFDFDDVTDILSALRGENGCPWDKAQTHESIRSNLIEEAYELVDAIDLKDKAKIIEETGDVLLQAVFHMTIARETGEFDFSDVYNALCAKLISRHTHIFGSDKALDGDEALRFWEKNKMKEKRITGATQNLTEVPAGMPALLRACKVQKRAAKYGLDFANVDNAFGKLWEEVEELKTAFDSADISAREEEAGDVLFSVVNVLRFLKIEPETALNGATEKYISRVTFMADEFEKRGGSFDGDNPVEIPWELWDLAKEAEKR